MIAISVLVLLAFLWIGRCSSQMYQIRKRSANDEAYTLEVVAAAGTQAELIAACRQIIALHSEDWNNSATLLDVPAVIMNLHPRRMFIYKDQVHILIQSPGRRTFVQCFDTHAEQYGTRMLTNGLWCANLNFDDKSPEEQRWIARRGDMRITISFEEEGQSGRAILLDP